MLVSRLAVKQARVRFPARHPRGVFPNELPSDEEMEAQKHPDPTDQYPTDPDQMDQDPTDTDPQHWREFSNVILN
jgi:hypothetical protein